MPQMPPPPSLPPIGGDDLVTPQAGFGEMGGEQDIMEMFRMMGKGKGGGY